METIHQARPMRARQSAPAEMDCAGAEDGDLLQAFIDDGDESAFAELVHRHGPMVLGVCRRVLGNAHDADDCFQAAFLVLVRKADSIQPPSMVGNWLYGVAYRTALEARKMAARRRVVERKQPPALPSAPADDRWGELRPVLDQELSRLPDKYRVVLIACDLQGQTRQQAARLLGLPEGTVASRLARARALLAKRLKRHKVTLSAVSLGSLMARHAAADWVPPGLTAATLSSAARLAAGKPVASSRVAELTTRVVQAMALSKWALAGAVLALLAIFGLSVNLFMPAVAGQRNQAAPAGNVKPEQAFSCILQTIDANSRTIEARGSDSFDAEYALLRLRVEPSTPILIDGRGAKLADLQAGYVVNLLFERSAAGAHRALRIEATGEALAGLVLAKDDESFTILSDNQGGKIEKKFELEKGAVTCIDGQKVKFGKLKIKMKVTVFMPFRKPGVAKKVEAAGPKKVGVLKAINAQEPALAFVADDAPVPVAKGAPVIIDGKKSRLGSLQPGMRVTLHMSAEPERDYAVGVVAVTAAKN